MTSIATSLAGHNAIRSTYMLVKSSHLEQLLIKSVSRIATTAGERYCPPPVDDKDSSLDERCGYYPQQPQVSVASDPLVCIKDNLIGSSQWSTEMPAHP